MAIKSAGVQLGRGGMIFDVVLHPSHPGASFLTAEKMIMTLPLIMIGTTRKKMTQQGNMEMM
jgi:hypothetical protein